MHQYDKRRNLIGWLFLAPALLLVIGLKWLPVLGTLVLSFFEWDILTPPKYVGLLNYGNLFSKDVLPLSHIASATYGRLICVVPVAALSILLALLVKREERWRRYFFLPLLLPVLVPLAADEVIWRWLFHTDFGFINGFLELLHIHGPDWLGPGKSFKWAAAIFNIWYLTGMLTLVTYMILRSGRAGLSTTRQLLGLLLALFIIPLPFYPGYTGFMLGLFSHLARIIYYYAFQMFEMGTAASVGTVSAICLLLLGYLFLRLTSGSVIAVSDENRSGKPDWTAGRITLLIILVLVSLTAIVPYLRALSTALTESGSQFYKPMTLLPPSLSWEGFIGVWKQHAMFELALLNTFHHWLWLVLLEVPICYLAAYALSIIRPAGTGIAGALLFIPIFLSNRFTMLPLFTVLKGALHTMPSLIAISLAPVFIIWLFKLYFDGLPSDGISSARVGGMSEGRILLTKVLPRSLPVIAVSILLTIVFAMNDAYSYLLTTASLEKPDLALGLAVFYSNHICDNVLNMAGAIPLILPGTLLYIIFSGSLLSLSLRRRESSGDSV